MPPLFSFFKLLHANFSAEKYVRHWLDFFAKKFILENVKITGFDNGYK